MEFAIQGEHVHFEHINLMGDAVSLYGNGETDFNHRLDLDVLYLDRPGRFADSAWKTIAGHVSQQSFS